MSDLYTIYRLQTDFYYCIYFKIRKNIKTFTLNTCHEINFLSNIIWSEGSMATKKKSTLKNSTKSAFQNAVTACVCVHARSPGTWINSKSCLYLIFTSYMVTIKAKSSLHVGQQIKNSPAYQKWRSLIKSLWTARKKRQHGTSSEHSTTSLSTIKNIKNKILRTISWKRRQWLLTKPKTLRNSICDHISWVKHWVNSSLKLG
jgi:hypothetical protein